MEFWGLSSVVGTNAEVPPLEMLLFVGFKPSWLSLTSFLHCYEMFSMTSYYFSNCFSYYFNKLRSSNSFSLHFFITSFFQHPLGSGDSQHSTCSVFSIEFMMLIQVALSSFSIFLILVWILSVNYFKRSLLFFTSWCIFSLKIRAISVLCILFSFSVIWSFFFFHFFFSSSKVSIFSM